MAYEKPLNELVKPDWLSEQDWKRALKAVESTEVIKRDAKAHLQRYQNSKGKEGFELAGCAVLLLTTIGRKSGKQVTTPLNFLELDGSYVVVGSLGGSAEDPNWAKNLKHTPTAWVQIKEAKSAVAVREIVGDERRTLWPRLVKAMPLWGVFVQRTDREFPIFVLTPMQRA